MCNFHTHKQDCYTWSVLHSQPGSIRLPPRLLKHEKATPAYYKNNLSALTRHRSGRLKRQARPPALVPLSYTHTCRVNVRNDGIEKGLVAALLVDFGLPQGRLFCFTVPRETAPTAARPAA